MNKSNSDSVAGERRDSEATETASAVGMHSPAPTAINMREASSSA